MPNTTSIRSIRRTARSGRYDDFVEIHLNAMMVMMSNQPSRGHQGPFFGPWHRVLLRQFELELKQIDAHVEIPYWDLDAPLPIQDLPYSEMIS